MRRPMCLACLIVAAFIYLLQQIFPERIDDFSAWNKKTVILEGVITSKDYKTKGNNRILVLTLDHTFIAGDAADTADGVSFPQDFSVQCSLLEETGGPGTDPASLPMHSRIRICGKLYSYPCATNPGEFDSRIYYKSIGLDCSLQNAIVTDCIRTGNPYSPDNILFVLRQKLGNVLDQTFPEEDAGILKAMLLGAKGDLSEDIRQLYKDSGIIHILAISGLHISIIGMGLWKILRKLSLPQPFCCIVPIIVMILYGRMTGLGASSFRAIFMFGLHMCASLMHRTYDLLTAVSIAAILLLIQQPLYLYNSGFLFSFSAVLAIGLLSPAITIPAPARRTFQPGTAGFLLHALLCKVFSSMQVPIAVMLATLPIHLQFYGTFPVYSILLNLLVLPMMSAIMVLGIVTLGTGLCFLAAARLTALPIRFILYFYKLLAKFSLILPGHTLIPGQSRIWQIVVYYSLLAAIVILHEYMGRRSHIPTARYTHRHKDNLTMTKHSFFNPAVIALMISPMTMACALVILLVRFDPGLSINIMDVGQGDGILISFQDPDWFLAKGRKHIFIDGGSTDHSKVGQYQVEPFLCTRGAGTIDLWVITHSDEDHTSGLLEFLEDDSNPIRISRIALPDSASPAAKNVSTIENLAAEKGIPIFYLSQGDQITYTDENPWDYLFEEEAKAGSDMLHAGGKSSSSAKKLTITCLHPSGDAIYSNANEYSITLLVQYGSFTALLTGDLEGAGEKDFLQYLSSSETSVNITHHDSQDGSVETSLDITLLKVAHHGSRGATSASFLSVVHPRLAVISCGRNNRYGHPHQETLERLTQAGAKIYDTRYTGEILFHTNGSALTVRPFLKDNAAS